MDEKEVQKIFIEILGDAINTAHKESGIAAKVTPDILVPVYRLAKKHDLAHIVAEFAFQNRIEMPQEVRVRFQQEVLRAVCRYEQMKYAYEQICSILDEAQIAYVPLKGSVIRPYYPVESMRTSCDIDILIYEEDLESAIRYLTDKGFVCGNKHYHDVSLYSPNNVHLELHFNIQENMDSLDSVLKHVWKHAVLEEGSRYKLNKEFFVFHIYAHMAYHFLNGGSGIRSLMDIWIMEHKMDASYMCAERLLKKAGIYKFAAEMSRLADQCFSNKDWDKFSYLVLKYIFHGGVYGSAENSIAVYKSKKNSSFAYLIERLFLPYRAMVETYSVLRRAPYLLPLFWIVRWIGAIFGGKSKRIALEMSYAQNVSKQVIEEVIEIRAKLDL